MDGLDAERNRQDLATTKRELTKLREKYDADRLQWEGENSNLRQSLASLQSTLDTITTQRNRESRDRTDYSKQCEDLRAENLKLRRELAQALDTKLSHLRTPQVSFEQYRELLQLTEHYAALLSGRAPVSAENKLPNEDKVLQAARRWTDNMSTGTAFQPKNQSAYDSIMNTMGAPSPAQSQVAPPQQQQSAPPLVPPLQPFQESGLGPNGYDATPRDMYQPSLAGGTDRGDSPETIRPTQQSAAATAAATGGAGGLTDRPIKENIVEGGKLIKIIRDATPNAGKHWSFHNTTTDTQFIVEFTFGPMCDIVALGDAEREGRVVRLNLFPGETKPFIRGVVNGYKMAIKYGPPDESFVPPSAMTDGELSPIVLQAKDVLSNLPPNAPASTLMSRCLAAGIPFIDTQFPPLSGSVSRTGESVEAPIRWVQPSGFLSTGQRPEVISFTPVPSDILMSEFRSNYLVGALRCVADDRELLNKIFILSTPEEAGSGLYRVLICPRGLWHDTVLDSYLPCDQHNAPVGMRCKNPKYLWPSLVEKAMAKTYGSYAALAGPGDPLEAIQDLTGFPTERLDWKTKETTLFGAIQKLCSVEGNMVMLFTPRAEGETEAGLTIEGRRAEAIGLLLGAGNRVLATHSVEGYRLCLIRFVVQEGKSKWNGPWSEGSDFWVRHPQVKQTCEDIKARCLKDPNSELLWMDWRDVITYFDGAGVCYSRPSWADYRIPVHFVGTKPSVMLELSVVRTTNLFINIHQPDKRGALLPSGDYAGGSDSSREPYGAFLITVVGCSPNGVWDTVAQSRGGNFWRGRDVHLSIQLRASDYPYYVLVRRYTAENERDVVASLQVENPHAVTVGVREPNDGVMSAVKYSPVWKFDPTPCQPKAVIGQFQSDTVQIPLPQGTVMAVMGSGGGASNTPNATSFYPADSTSSRSGGHAPPSARTSTPAQSQSRRVDPIPPQLTTSAPTPTQAGSQYNNARIAQRTEERAGYENSVDPLLSRGDRLAGHNNPAQQPQYYQPSSLSAPGGAIGAGGGRGHLLNAQAEVPRRRETLPPPTVTRIDSIDPSEPSDGSW